MTTRKKWLIGGGSALGVVLIAGFAVYWFVLRSDTPPPVDIDSAVAAVTSSTQPVLTTAATPATTGTPATSSPTATTGSTTGSPATTSPDPTTPPASGLDGEWIVDPTAGSFVGYRVREELANIGFTEAVGRTSGVEGTLTISGSTITSVVVEADMRRLQSDDDRRDRTLGRQALQTNTFPTAGFTLTAPIELGLVPVAGETISAVASGDLMVHGVTHAVQIPLDAQLVNDRIVVVGSIDVVFADYGISAPSAIVVLSVEDKGVVELQLVFTKA